MIFLLSTQALLDILTDEPAMANWRLKTPVNAVEVSAVSIGEAITTIEKVSNPGRRRALGTALDIFVATASRYQGITPFEENIARIWADIEATPDLIGRSVSGREDELSSPARMIVATCLVRGATLVEAPQPYHSKVKLKVVSP
jgi:predicted nucleic acid-binding protein